MRAFSTLLSLVALASSLSLATASIGSDRHANGGLEIRKHHHHTTTKHHHRLPSEPTGRKHHKGHHKPDADNEDKPKTKKKHHSTTTTKKHHHHTTTPAQAKPTSSHKTKTTAKAATTTAKSTTHATSHPQATHKYGLLYSDKVRGVNLGNWLVVENWMDKRLDTALKAIAVHAPASVVKKTKGKPIVDEYTMGLYADKEQASALVMEHFEKWMTEKDWKRIAQYGLNSVRISFPHYAFADCIEKGAPCLPLNRVEKLKEGVLLAKKYGIKVWISLHTLPGSQNGYDSSGRIGPPGWATKADYATLSTRAFNHLVSIFSEEPYASATLAIEPANEPTAAQSPEILATLKKYYPLAYDMVHKANTVSRIQPASPIRFAAHDGWKGMRYWSEPVAFFDESARQQMFLGMHPYYIFGDDVKNMTDSQRIAKACTFGEKIATYSSVYTIVASECGINAPRGDSGWGRDMHQADHLQFEDPELDYPFSDEYMRFLALNFRAQQQAYERGAGWMIWSWKHFQHRDWSYKSGVRYGWLPRTPAELDHQPFGKLCP